MEKPVINTVIEVTPTGNKNWSGGAYTLAYMYSNKGNILFKGYYSDIKELLKKEYSDRRYFIVFNLYPYKRTLIKFSNEEPIYIPQIINYRQRGSIKRLSKKYIIYLPKNKKIYLKRLPTSWNKTMNDIFEQTEIKRNY